jgi:hypothetical protein
MFWSCQAEFKQKKFRGGSLLTPTQYYKDHTEGERKMSVLTPKQNKLSFVVCYIPNSTLFF